MLMRTRHLQVFRAQTVLRQRRTKSSLQSTSGKRTSPNGSLPGKKLSTRPCNSASMSSTSRTKTKTPRLSRTGSSWGSQEISFKSKKISWRRKSRAKRLVSPLLTLVSTSTDKYSSSRISWTLPSTLSDNLLSSSRPHFVSATRFSSANRSILPTKRAKKSSRQ